MLQGQQNVGVTEKQLSDLVHMTDEVLKQKVCTYIPETEFVETILLQLQIFVSKLPGGYISRWFGMYKFQVLSKV